MKQLSIITLATVLLLLVGIGSVSYAGTYASSLRATNPDSTQAFDGSFSDGTGAKLWFTLNGHADSVKVWVVQGGPGGNKIRSFATLLNLAAGPKNVMWDGKDDSGKVVMTGRFSFEVFTSDTGNSSAQWVQAWQNPVYLLSGGGLSSRDVEVVQDPASPGFGNLILTESTTTYGYARMLVAHANGSFKGEYARTLFPQGTSDFDPWFISIAQNGTQYVTNSSLSKIFVFRDTALVNTIQDAKIGSPRGIATVGSGEPTLFIATGKAVVRRNPAGVVDTIFADTAAAGYTRDVALDDSGYVYISFGGSSTAYTKVVRLSRTFARMDTLTLPDNVTHINIYNGANRSSNADDILYCRVRGVNGGVFKLDFAGKSSTKLFTPSTSTSGSHSIGIDILGNIYYANPSAEWVQMYIPPSSAPTKWATKGGPMVVLSSSTKLVDSFESGVGHFGTHPTYSGSTIGISTSSAAKHQPMEGYASPGSMEVVLVDDPASTNEWQVRFLSGVGATGANDSLAPQGWIGYWLKTRSAPPGAMVAIGIDDPSDPTTKRSIKLPVINDGAWHVYQWNMGDSTQWTPWVVTSGSPKLKGPRVSVDAVWFFAPDSSAPWKINFDDVTYNALGTVGLDAGTGDVTGNGTISALDGSWILQHVAGIRPFTPQQTLAGDVNLSHNGTAVNAFDAAVVLANVVAKIPYLPWRQPVPGGFRNTNGSDEVPTINLYVSTVKGTAGSIVSIPISIPANLAGLRSAEMKLNFDPALLKVRGVTSTSLTKDFVVVSNIENGSVKIAMASGDEITSGGQILSVEAEILKSSESITLSIDNILLNEDMISKVTSVGSTLAEIPQSYELLQNYPNPFNPSTTIGYRLPERGFVELNIYDISGREVVTLVSTVQDAGEHRITWNASDARGVKVSSGVYLYRLTAGAYTQIKKMVLLK